MESLNGHSHPDESNGVKFDPPTGKYTIVGIDVDTTGRRLIDEIVQISAYTPNSQFGQYIMPIMNLNPAATQRHQIRVITIGFFRMLKSMQSYKILKTKTEVAALRDFIEWIRSLKDADKDSKGVILIYHEQWKFVPYMILEAMKKYDLLDQFLDIVKYFVNGYKLAENKCANTVKYYSLRQLAKIMLNRDENTSPNVNSKRSNSPSSTNTSNSNNTIGAFDGNSGVRAKLCYDIVEHLAKGEQEDLNTDKSKNMFELLSEFAYPVSIDVNELDGQNKCVDRQNSLRLIFVNYFKTSRYHRVKAVTFRRVLAEYGYDLKTLEEIWNSAKKNGLTEIVQVIEQLKPEEKTELVELLDSHFDPEKDTIKPVVKKSRRRMSRRVQKGTSFKKSMSPKSKMANGGGGGGGGEGDQHDTSGDSIVKEKLKSKQNDDIKQPLQNHHQQQQQPSLIC